ncbi:MAG: hypothetical protein PHE15_07010 [Dehalococcoidales bacterium]|nr:hypothetical protein [Dehalococcoidales bacterium]
MDSPYEYALATEFVIPKPEADILSEGPDYSDPKMQRAFTLKVSKTLNNLSKSLPNLNGGGWLIVSHNISQVEGATIISFLLQRPKCEV